MLIAIAGGRGVALPEAPAQVFGYYTTTGGASSVGDARLNLSRAGNVEVDVGAAQMCVEAFFLGNTTTNAQSTPTSAASYAGNATDGNIAFDFDGTNTGRGSIMGFDVGIPYIGVNNAGGAQTLVGNANVLVDAWRHVAFQFTANTGLMQVLGNGLLQATVDGPNGSVAHADTTGDTDDDIGIGFEKLLEGFGYGGGIAMIRISNVIRYSVTDVGDPYTVPTAAFEDDENTMGLYLMEEEDPTADSSGNANVLEVLDDAVWTEGGPFA